MIVSEFADLTGSCAVVTGSSSGIGRAMALEFARAGAKVVVHYARSKKKADSLVKEILKNGSEAVAIQHDLLDGNFDAFVQSCWDAYGTVDIWVNNAGVDLLTGEGPLLSYEEKFHRLIDIDVKGTLLLSKLAADRMKAQTGGTILNIGWDQADRGMEGDSGELFATSKNAIMAATRALALSYAPEVRINCIAPGWILTAWGETASDEWQARVRRETPLDRWGTPEDIANMARFLVSPDASYITGQVINVNGGAVR